MAVCLSFISPEPTMMMLGLEILPKPPSLRCDELQGEFQICRVYNFRFDRSWKKYHEQVWWRYLKGIPVLFRISKVFPEGCWKCSWPKKLGLSIGNNGTMAAEPLGRLCVGESDEVEEWKLKIHLVVMPATKFTSVTSSHSMTTVIGLLCFLFHCQPMPSSSTSSFRSNIDTSATLSSNSSTKNEHSLQ